jgi:uncharacterized protein YajQ (UPF0234 family)
VTEDHPNTQDEELVSEVTEAEVNNAVTKARKESHPGDARRVMGSNNNSTKKTTNVNHADFSTSNVDDTFLDDVIASYWNSDSSDSEDDQDFQ